MGKTRSRKGKLNKPLLGGRARRTDSWAHFTNISLSHVILVVIALEMGPDGSFLPISQKRNLWLRKGGMVGPQRRKLGSILSAS